MVIKNGVFRMFFDRLFLIGPELFEVTAADALELSKRCGTLRWVTAREMAIPEKFMQPAMMHLPIVTLIQRSKLLQDAANEIDLIPFITNPIDIMAKVFNCLKMMEEFVRENSFQNRFGMFVSMFDQAKVSSASDQMSFDDFFPIFCSVFAVSAPSNASAIGDLMARLTGLGLPASFDFAKLFFTSAVQYVSNFDRADFDQQMDDDEDPLGVKTRNKAKKT
jgi:hypothetical protein